MEYVTQIHTGADGTVQMSIPEEWSDRDVTVTLEAVQPSHLEDTVTEAPENLAEALEGLIGTVSYDVPDDLLLHGGYALSGS